MAPSNMFSYLRPGHAKRNASSLASPEPNSSPAAYPLPSPSHNTDYFPSPRFNDNASYTSSSPISPFPPQLPPIARVASKLDTSTSANSSEHTSSQPISIVGGGNIQMAHDRGVLSPPLRAQEQLLPNYEYNSVPARPTTGSTPTGLRVQRLNGPQITEDHQHLETPSQSSTHLARPGISPSYSSFSKSQTSLMSGISDKLAGSSKTTAPTIAPAKGKSRLNLRNPMSLLMRRRSGQTLDPLSDESLVTPSVVPPMPDNYDPSIRGHIVHDFNAPRINRNFSYNNAYPEDQTPQDLGRVSPPKIDREHTPVFREHFDDDTSYEQSQAAIRAEQLADKRFLARNSVQLSPPPPLPKDSSPPLPESYSPPSRPPPQPLGSSHSVLPSSDLSPVQETSSPIDAPAEVTPRKRKSTKTPPPARSRATSVTDPSFQPAGLPAHFSSRASRFSFQIPGGSDSTQEKLLEERHKAKEAEKASKQVRMSTNTMDDEYDEYNMDDYDMDGGFDEEIPMLGEEDDFGGLGDQTLDSGINAFDFSSLSIQPGFDPMSPVGQLQTPVDVNGNPIGFAMSGGMLQQSHHQAFDSQPSGQVSLANEPQGLGLVGLQSELRDSSPPVSLDASAEPGPTTYHEPGFGNNDFDDDMYFDDGLIGDQEEDAAVEFDENVFDDPSGPLYARRVNFTPGVDAQGALAPYPPGFPGSETGYEADDDTVSKHLEKSEPSLAHKTSVAAQRTVPDFNNMDAYYGALAEAANRAEAAGRFARKASVDAGQASSDVEEFSSLTNSRPSLVPDDGRFSLDTDGFPPDDDGFGMSASFVDDYDYSDFDSALEDDPIIAAANAEALAFDDEGFYGQEFGFYASAVGESSSAWGGFFGPSGLGRTVSGRNAVREPNLTPITERSEYSTRNSFISLNHFRDGQQPLNSPGLAQLARMSPYGWAEEEDMSLDSLMKLRKGAFGGSAASLPGSTSHSPRNSSPMGMQLYPRTASAAGTRMVEQNDSVLESDESANITDDLEGDEEDKGLMDAVNAAYEDEDELDHEESDGEERPESPTLTASDYNSLSSPANHILAKDTPLLPPISELYAQRNVPLPPHSSLSSPSNIALPMSPHGIPQGSPFMSQQRPPAPPSINTSLSSPSATVSTSTAPRRQSLGLVSPISTSSPITPSGGWRGGHSRKGSAADSVTYVREHDEAGEGRWVLERRRTAESGELELIGREIVEGGRI
ncbi:Nn.00g044360.m01.CDS01 [Neocucurbitaria sp. VM-36]